MFNSLDYVKVLEDVGLPRNQAETHVRILGRLIGEDMASKEDIRGLETKMTDDIKRLEAKVTDDIKRLESKMDDSISRLEAKIDDGISKLEAKMATKDDLGKLEAKMAYEFQSLEHRMTLKLGGLMAAFLATGLTAAKLLFI